LEVCEKLLAEVTLLVHRSALSLRDYLQTIDTEWEGETHFNQTWSRNIPVEVDEGYMELSPLAEVSVIKLYSMIVLREMAIYNEMNKFRSKGSKLEGFFWCVSHESD
jgi:hypothetical protein